jgi:hypothetical protein
MAIRKIVSRSINDGAIVSADLDVTGAGGTGAALLAKGTTAQRPGSPVEGHLRYNTTIGLYEQYTATGWQAVDAPPTVSNISGTINENTNSTITITGTGFKSGATVYVDGAAVGNISRSMVTTFVSSTQLTFATNATSVNFTGGSSFDIRVINTSGLSGVLSAAGTIDRDPVWSTAAGTIATINDAYGSYSPIVTLSAPDPDGGSTTYAVTSGSLPPGTSLNSSTGAISGDPTDVATSTTSTFTVTATSNTQAVPRTFSIIVNPTADGSSSARAATSAASIKSITGTSTNGLYWINMNGTPFQIYCDMTRDGGGWMLTYRCKNYNNQGCTQGVWDFDIALGAGGSTTPTSPTGALSGLTEGFSPSNRWSLWTSTGATMVRATAGTGATVNIDCKYTGTYPDRANMWLYGANGNNNNPIGGNSGTGSYSNTYVPGNQASNTNGTTVNQVVYIYANNFSLTNGNSYSLYSFGYLNCGCCEYYSINGSDAWNSNSTAVHLFGDGRGVSNSGMSYGGEWTSFWIK